MASEELYDEGHCLDFIGKNQDSMLALSLSCVAEILAVTGIISRGRVATELLVGPDPVEEFEETPWLLMLCAYAHLVSDAQGDRQVVARAEPPCGSGAQERSVLAFVAFLEFADSLPVGTLALLGIAIAGS